MQTNYTNIIAYVIETILLWYCPKEIVTYQFTYTQHSLYMICHCVIQSYILIGQSAWVMQVKFKYKM